MIHTNYQLYYIKYFVFTGVTDSDRDMRIWVSYCLTFRMPGGNYFNINLHHYHYLDIIRNIDNRLRIFIFLSLVTAVTHHTTTELRLIIKMSIDWLVQ